MSFGLWLRQRRKALDLTQEELAQRVGCSTAAIRKIESEERRPSKQIAERLADVMSIPPAERPAFVKFARGDPWADPRGRAALPLDRVPWRRPRRPINNLPAQLTPLIGRDGEVAAVRDLLRRDEIRLLTLFGPPGIGKTRLAIQAAAGLSDDFEDGLVFVALAPIREPALVAPAIAQALGIQEVAGQVLSASLAASLGDKQLLLLLDSFERVIEAGRMVVDLLAACPWLKVLATSRAALNVRGERLHPLRPLTLPNLDRLSTVAKDPATALAQYSALALFVERAQAVKPDFGLTPDNAVAVATLCAQLDGLPLAIELIAARSKLLPPQALLARLSDRFAWQADALGARTTRHRTLEKAIGWSYELLTAEEQTLFARLAVFAGGWTLEAAEAVAGDESPATGDSELPLSTHPRRPSVLESTASLLDKSLLKREPEGRDEPRFAMLETIRKYALQRLQARGAAEVEALRRRHADYFLTLAEAAEPHLAGAEQRAWLDRLERDHDNLRAALGWALEHQAAASAARLSGALRHFWAMHGHLGEGRRWLERARSLATQDEPSLPPSARVKVLNGEGSLAYYLGDYAAARSLFEAGLALARAAGDKPGMAFALDGLGAQAANQGEYSQATRYSEQSLAISREIGDRWLSAITLISLGELARLKGEPRQAIPLYEESLALLREVGDRWFRAIVLHDLGQVAHDEGQHARASVLHRQSLALCREVGNQRGIATCLEKLAGVLASQGQAEGAVRLLGAAEALREASNIPRGAVDRPDYEHFVAAARALLAEAAFETAWEEGRAMPLEKAIAYAVAT